MEGVNVCFYLGAFYGSAWSATTGQTLNEGEKTLLAFFVKSAQLDERLCMVVHSKIQREIVFVTMNPQRGRLLATFITTCSLASVQSRKQTFSHGQTSTGQVGFGACLDHTRTGQHVASHCQSIKDQVSTPVDTGLASVCSAGALDRQQMNLALVTAFISRQQRGQRICCAVTPI
jgi:hypothetical protein